jgi:hypothetical protein
VQTHSPLGGESVSDGARRPLRHSRSTGYSHEARVTLLARPLLQVTAWTPADLLAAVSRCAARTSCPLQTKAPPRLLRAFLPMPFGHSPRSCSQGSARDGSLRGGLAMSQCRYAVVTVTLPRRYGAICTGVAVRRPSCPWIVSTSPSVRARRSAPARPSASAGR